MSAIEPTTTLEQPFSPVKSNIPHPLYPHPDSMIHHKEGGNRLLIVYRERLYCRDKGYGVSSSQRVLSPQLLFKRYDLIRKCLQDLLGLSTAQREVTLRLLRYWAYYGQVYPKEAQVTEEQGCSKATFWRTISLLEQLGLIHVINRYVIRHHAQISNLYRFDKLLIVIARYLAEHGTAFLEKWLQPYLQLPGQVFWGSWVRTPESRAEPGL